MHLKELLGKLLGKFTHFNINYCVLRNHEGLPDINHGRDIDFLVNKSDMDSIILALNSIDGLMITGITKRNFITAIYIYGVENNQSYGLELDFIHDVGYKGLSIFSSEELLCKSYENEKGIRILPDVYENIITFLSSFICAGYINDKYLQKQIECFQLDPMVTLELFSNIFGMKYGEVLFNNLLKSDKKQLIKLRKKSIVSLYCNKLSFKNTYNMFKHFYLETCLRVSRCNSIRIAFLGPDGAGKSTILDTVLSNIEGTANKIDLCHLKPTLLFKNRIQERGVVTDPHAAKSRGLWMSYIKLIFWIFEYNLASLKRVRNFQIEIFDRYYHDIYIDPKRYLFSGSKTFIKLVEFFIPKPDVFFVIIAEPKTIQERKQEVSFEETERQVNEYKAFSESKKNSYLVVNEDNIEFAIKDVESKIIKTLSDKCKGTS